MVETQVVWLHCPWSEHLLGTSGLLLIINKPWLLIYLRTFSMILTPSFYKWHICLRTYIKLVEKLTDTNVLSSQSCPFHYIVSWIPAVSRELTGGSCVSVQGMKTWSGKVDFKWVIRHINRMQLNTGSVSRSVLSQGSRLLRSRTPPELSHPKNTAISGGYRPHFGRICRLQLGHFS